jgi:bla regulator protein blaR1
MMLLELMVKASLTLIAGLIAVRAAKRASASVRHVLLVATFGALLLLPLLMTLGPIAPILVPAIPVPALARIASPVGTPAAGEPTAANRGESARDRAAAPAQRSPLVSWSAVASAVQLAWLAGAVCVAGSLAFGVWRLARMARSGVPWLDVRSLLPELVAEAGVRRTVHVVLDEAVSAPLTCGWLRPTIVLPWDATEWSDADVRRALVHELEHVRRGDWGVQVLARLTCAAYWFHPMAWRALDGLCLEAERACDDAVLARSASEDYAEQLVSLASRIRSGRALPALAMASRGDLSVRVMALLDAGQCRGRVGMRTTVAASITALVVVGALASVRTVRAATTVNNGALPTRSDAQVLQTRPPAAEAEREDEDDDDPLVEVLIKAAERGDVRRLTALLDGGANVNAALDGDGTALIGAARKGRLEAVGLLLDRGADVNKAVGGDGNPLIMAAGEGYLEVVELLLNRGAAIDEIVPGDENPLIQASANGQLAVVRLLIQRGANVNARAWSERNDGAAGGEWRTPLNQARRRGHRDVVALLESAGARD